MKKQIDDIRETWVFRSWENFRMFWYVFVVLLFLWCPPIQSDQIDWLFCPLLWRSPSAATVSCCCLIVCLLDLSALGTCLMPLAYCICTFCFCILLLYNAATAAAAEFEEDKIMWSQMCNKKKKKQQQTWIERDSTLVICCQWSQAWSCSKVEEGAVAPFAFWVAKVGVQLWSAEIRDGFGLSWVVSKQRRRRRRRTRRGGWIREHSACGGSCFRASHRIFVCKRENENDGVLGRWDLQGYGW
jgi:hypothetical protein